jgi:hypothetical protein
MLERVHLDGVCVCVEDRGTRIRVSHISDKAAAALLLTHGLSFPFRIVVGTLVGVLRRFRAAPRQRQARRLRHHRPSLVDVCGSNDIQRFRKLSICDNET